MLKPEVRYRGIYQTMIYTADVKVNIDYNTETAKDEIISFANKISPPHCEEKHNNKGIVDIQVKINGENAPFKLSNAVVIIPMPAGKSHCEIQFKLRGSDGLEFYPASKKSKITINGNWDSPSFIGSSLPSNRTIEKDKFNAQWDFGGYDTIFSSAGVELYLSASIYQQVARCFNYATFFLIVFFFTLIVGEFFTKINIHILQYLIASGAPVLFYLMTLAFAEKIGFTFAYIISAAIIVAMVTMYSRMFWRKTIPALIMGGILAISYLSNFFIIRMEDFALLSGTMLLAIILGVLMFITGKMNQK